MLSVWLGGAVCVACIAVGWWSRTRYRKRQDVMADFVSLLVFATEQITYGMTPLPAICRQFADLHPHSPLAAACRDYPTLTGISVLTGAQWANIEQLMLSLGHSDVSGQSNRLAYARVEAERMRQAAAEDARAKGDLYAKLWVVLGIGLMIWMV